VPLSPEELDALGLTDEQRARVEALNTEAVTFSETAADLAAKSKETAVDKRIEELKEMGINTPSALKHYRRVYLANDDMPAVVALSDNGQPEKMTALEILDGFIDAAKGTDGKVTFSDQHMASGNDEPPPSTDNKDDRPISDRVADMKAALGRA
jgi:hypothetical protein